MSERISVPGTYRGYSAVLAESYRRSSRYFKASDGCRLALDLYQPTRAGEPLAGRRPLVVIATGYRRAFRLSPDDPAHVRGKYPHLKAGDLTTFVNRASHLPAGRDAIWATEHFGPVTGSLAEWVRAHGSAAEYLLLHGYAIVVVDVRGTGASFGRNYGEGWQCGRDLAELFAALAAEPWCDGSIGMIGSSWLGATQYFAMTYGTPHLKAAIPQMASFDVYDSWYPGGVYLSGFLRQWSARRAREDSVQAGLPVDEDPRGELLQAALAERAAERYPTDEHTSRGRNVAEMPRWSRDQMETLFPCRGKRLPDGTVIDLEYSALDFRRANQGRTAVYFWGGWWDLFARGMSIAYWNYRGPKKLLVGPWHHTNFWDVEEAHRWFDYWLRGIDNGITREPPVTFSTSTARGVIAGWTASAHWPFALARPVNFALASGPSGTIASANDGRLASEAGAAGEDGLSVDYAASSGRRSRVWYHTAPHLDYTALAENDRKGLTYTSAPLGAPLEITGFPRLTLVLRSSATRGMVIAYLEEVGEDGGVHLLSEGLLNLEFRDEQPAPIEIDGLIHRSYAEATRRAVAPGERMIVRFDLAPVSAIVAGGHRLRLAIHGADVDNYYVEPLEPPARLSVSRGEGGSILTLPVVAPSAEREALHIEEAFRALPPAHRFATRLPSHGERA